MCGIVAVIGTRDAAPLLLEGLRQLEYRGYDSAGIATVHGGQLSHLRAEGKLINLTQRFDASGAAGSCGIGHTRWATHGKPEERNAHPHLDGSGELAVVQNGIIENHRSLREHLEAGGVAFQSDTDTEVIPHLVSKELNALLAAGSSADGATLLKAVQQTLPQLDGAYALAVVWAQCPDALVVARRPKQGYRWRKEIPLHQTRSARAPAGVPPPRHQGSGPRPQPRHRHHPAEARPAGPP